MPHRCQEGKRGRNASPERFRYMPLDPSDPHDLRSTDEASIETAHLAMDGLSEEDSVQKVIAILKKVDGVREVHGTPASGIVTVTFDARKTHVPALHDALLKGGYTPARTATN